MASRRASTAGWSASPTTRSRPASGSTTSAISPTCSSTRRCAARAPLAALIEAVAAAARAHGCPRYYWQTKQDNARARALYDKVARFAGFIRYDYPMA